MLLLPPGIAPSTVTRLSVKIDDRPGVLLRVLGTCQRRGAQVHAMTYADGRIELALSADEQRLALIRARLESIIDVLTVDDASS